MRAIRDLVVGCGLAALVAAAIAARAGQTAEFLEISKGWGSVVADLDGDGHDDLFITGHDSDDRVWYWTRDGYKPSAQVLPWVDRHDCDAADVDHDGRLDLYCTVGAQKGVGLKANELWLQQPDGRFAAASSFGAEDPSGRGRALVFLDVNHDGYADLYVTNQAGTRPDGLPNFNHLYLNQRGRGFIEKTTVATGERGFQCARKGDMNGDGWDDLVVCHEKGPPHLYINDRNGDFRELATPAASGEWRDARLADLDGDGRDDLALITAENSVQVWINSGAPPYFGKLAFKNTPAQYAAALTVGRFGGDLPSLYVVLQDEACRESNHDRAPDVIYHLLRSGGWRKETLAQDFEGCGHLADTVDGDKVLLENGGVAWKGPNYVLGFGE